MLDFAKELKPLALLSGDLLPANDDSLLPLAAANGELELAVVLPKPPKGDAVELAKPPKPDDLNLSSDVCGNKSTLSDPLTVPGWEAIVVKGDAEDVFAKPLPGGICIVLVEV